MILKLPEHMKKFTLSLLFISFFGIGLAQAQLRDDLSSPFDFGGTIINSKAPTVQNGLNRFFSSIKMSHSYDMSFSSFGGSYQNVNAYTNTMEFAFSDKLGGRVDVSFLHSPFGGTSYSGQTGFDNQIMIRNAELNYKINDKAFIRFQYQQLPSHYGYNPYGYNRFNRSNFGYWY